MKQYYHNDKFDEQKVFEKKLEARSGRKAPAPEEEVSLSETGNKRTPLKKEQYHQEEEDESALKKSAYVPSTVNRQKRPQDYLDYQHIYDPEAKMKQLQQQEHEEKKRQ